MRAAFAGPCAPRVRARLPRRRDRALSIVSLLVIRQSPILGAHGSTVPAAATECATETLHIPEGDPHALSSDTSLDRFHPRVAHRPRRAPRRRLGGGPALSRGLSERALGRREHLVGQRPQYQPRESG